MGISGLLGVLKEAGEPSHLRDFAGTTLAIDAYVWLHKGIYSCAQEVATGKFTTKYVDYFVNRIKVLEHYNIKPYFVFDGGPLPSKSGTEIERSQ